VAGSGAADVPSNWNASCRNPLSLIGDPGSVGADDIRAAGVALSSTAAQEIRKPEVSVRLDPPWSSSQ